jgi:hypothetical protein
LWLLNIDASGVWNVTRRMQSEDCLSDGRWGEVLISVCCSEVRMVPYLIYYMQLPVI